MYHLTVIWNNLMTKAALITNQFNNNIMVNIIKIVSFLTTIALLSANVIIIEYQLITGTLQYFGFNLNDNMVFLSIFIALLPTVFIMKWKHITFVSVLSVLSIIVLIITFIVVWIAASNRFPGGYVSSERFQNTSFDHKNAAQFAIDRMTVLERILFAFFYLQKWNKWFEYLCVQMCAFQLYKILS
eukprot:974509_1